MPFDRLQTCRPRCFVDLRAAAIVVAAMAGCFRAPIDRVCPELEAGDLVITELRGPQRDVDTWGQFIEIANRRAQEVAYDGITLRVSRLDGSGLEDFLVRDHSLVLAAGGYAVLGRFKPGELPAHVDYGFRGDFDKDLYPDGVVELRSCGELIDRAVYASLPSRGSAGIDGAATPEPGANDEASDWCVDETFMGGASQLGTPGSPGKRNIPCP